VESARIARALAQRLRFPGAELALVVKLVEDHPKFKDVFKMREATLQRFIREPHFEPLLALHRAVATATDGNLAFYEFCLSRWKELQASAALEEGKLLTGEDLIQLGMRPGPQFARILRAVEDLALERKLKTKEDALEYVVKHFVS
jgi:poly(A) polymerase